MDDIAGAVPYFFRSECYREFGSIRALTAGCLVFKIVPLCDSLVDIRNTGAFFL